MAIRLAHKICDTFQFQFAKICYFTNSSSVLGMLHKDSVAFHEFVGNRVSEIKSKSNVSQWAWVPTDKNPADLGTRTNCTPAELGPETTYQKGMPWMCTPFDQWPTKSSFSAPPPEELRRDLVMAMPTGVMENIIGELVPKFGSLKKLIRVVATIGFAVKRWKEYRRSDPRAHPLVPLSMQIAAEHELLAQAQKMLSKNSLDSLLPSMTSVTGIRGQELPLILVGGRSKLRYAVGYDQPGIPVLPASHPLARLYIKEAHESDHGGINAAVMRSRQKVWIIQGARMAKQLISKCFKCKLIYKPFQEQKMAPLPPPRVGPAPIFHSTAVDLFGPVYFSDMAKKRVKCKGWGVIFVCTATSAIHIELADSYSSDAFIKALRRFICMRGTPARIYSDRGTQLVEAAKQVTSWNFSQIQEWCNEKKFVWEFVPTQGQHMNGQAERMIGLVKRVPVPILENKKYSYEELNTVLAEVAIIVNSRPIGIKGRAGNIREELHPISPLHLMLGRGSINPPPDGGGWSRPPTEAHLLRTNEKRILE